MRATTRQMGLWSKIVAKIPFSRKRPLGYDLAGNRYYELPNPNGGRQRRVVEYADSPTSHAYSSVEDYRSGTAQLPVQWTAWMSYTRDTPPSMDELRVDAARQSALRERVKLIEAREREERILQGYLMPDGSEANDRKVPQALGGHSGASQIVQQGEEGGGGGAGEKAGEGDGGRGLGMEGKSGLFEFASAGGKPHASAKFAYPPAPRERMPETSSRPTPAFVDLAANARVQGEKEVEGQQHDDAQAQALSATETIAPPRPKVDALSTDANTLRQLAEEDTKRRMRESGVSEAGSAEGEGVQGVQGAGGLKPRKRGSG